MSKIKVWKCDVCGDIFMDGGVGYADNFPVDFSIPAISSIYSSEDEKFSFGDVCGSCRNELRSLVQDWISRPEVRREE